MFELESANFCAHQETDTLSHRGTAEERHKCIGKIFEVSVVVQLIFQRTITAFKIHK